MSSLQFPAGMLAGQALHGIMPSATEEVLRLRKELRLKDAEFSKERAILEQKNQQLEQQLKDSKDREENQKRIHDTMINCLNSNDPTQTSQAISILQQNEKQLKAEINDLLSKNRMLHDEIEIKEKNYKRNLDDKDMKIKDLEIQIERMRLDQKQMQMEFDQDKKELNIKLQNAVRDREQDGQKAEIKFKVENNDLKNEIERLRLVHQRDTEKMKSEFEMNLKEMKMIHEQEKFNLQYKAEKSNNDLSSLINKINAQGLNESHRSETVIRKREELEQEIMSLHHEVEQIKVQYDIEISKVTQDKVQAENKAMKLQKSLDKIKNAPKPVKIDLAQSAEQKQQDSTKVIQSLREEIESLLKENEKLNEQVKKFRKETLESSDYIEKLETNERKLRQQLKEKSTSDLTSDQVMDLKKQINKEKRRNIDLQEQYNHLNDDFQKIRDQNLGEMLEKDKKIAKLSKELREAERKILDIQSVFNSNQPQIQSRNQSPFGAITMTQQDPNHHMRNISYNPLTNTPSTLNMKAHHQSQNSQVNYQLSPKVMNGGGTYNNTSNMCGVMQEGNQMMKTIPQIEYTMLKTCQRMADSAIRMECGICSQVFETTDFDIHIMSDHPQPKHIRNQTQNTFNNVSGLTNNHAPHFSSGKQNNAVKRYAEDVHSSTQQLPGILQQSSPKRNNVKSREKSSAQANNWIKNSRSFTCILNDLNEIEEEEKISTNQINMNNDPDQSYFMKQHTVKSKSPINHAQQEAESLKSRNTNQHVNNGSIIQMSTVMSGNTIQSVLRSQKELKKQKSNGNISGANTSRVNQPQSVTVLTACRTEIQNLKRENKKMSYQLQNQEQKLNDISKDCSKIKKHVKKDSGKQSNKINMETELKGLIDMIGAIQGNSKDTTGAYTSRQNNNNMMPMCTDSIVELRSSASSVHNKKKKNHQKKKTKSPLQDIVLSSNPNRQFISNDNGNKSHRDNKENMQAAVSSKHATQTTLNKMPKLNLQTKFNKQASNDDEFLSSSSGDYDKRSIVQVEKRTRIIKRSDELCSNSPRRYKNYFEVIKSLVEPTSTNQDSNSNQNTTRAPVKSNRYSPQHTNDENSNYKLKQAKSSSRVQNNTNFQQQNFLAPNTYNNLNTNPAFEMTADNRHSRNLNMPFAISNSKYVNQQNTINSSNNNLVLYDSSNTDIFKSKNLKYQPTVHLTTGVGAQHTQQQKFHHYHRSNESKRDDVYDQQQNYSIEMNGADIQMNILNNGSSASNNTSQEEDFEETHDLRERDRRLDVRRSNEKIPNLGEGIFQSSHENEFVTGRFCDNGAQGKQFLFKYSANNSHNNSTVLRNNLTSNNNRL